MFLIRNFTGFIELGLTPEHLGGTPEQIRACCGTSALYTSTLSFC